MTPSEIVYKYKHSTEKNAVAFLKDLDSEDLWTFIGLPSRFVALDAVAEFPFTSHKDYWEYADLLQPYIVKELRSRYDSL